MTITTDLLDVDGTFLKTIASVSDRGWAHPRRGPGAGALTMRNDHPDHADLSWFRIIRGNLDGNPAFEWIIHRDPTQRLTADGKHQKVTTFAGAGTLAYLGMGDFHSAVVIGDGDSGLKTFGWVANEWDVTTWTSPAPHSGGHWDDPRNPNWEGQPDRWPDKRAEWILSEDAANPSADMWIRHDLDAHPAQDAVLFLSGTFVDAWFNGEHIARVERRTDMVKVNLDLTGDDVLALQVTGGEVIWTIGVEDADGNLNVLYRSTTGAPYDTSQPEIQRIIVDAEAEPYPWGNDYPSTGPDNLQGKIYFVYGGDTSAGVSVIEASGTFSAAAVEADLEALLGEGVSVTGTGTSADPLLVTWDASGPRQLLQLDHHDLRHDHDSTGVKRIQKGKTVSSATTGEDKIYLTLTEPAGVTYGYVMSRLIAAAQALGEIPAVTWTFTDALDSNGNAWSVSLPIVAYRVQVQIGDVCVQATQQFKADCQMLPGLVLGLYDSLGSDLSGSVQLTDATAAAAEASMNRQAPRATRARIETDGGFGYAVDAAAEAAYGRRTTGATYGTAQTVAEVVAAAEELLDELRGNVPQVVRSGGPAGARPYTDFTVGDYVGVRETAGGAYLPARVETISVVDLVADEQEFDLDLERRL